MSLFARLNAARLRHGKRQLTRREFEHQRIHAIKQHGDDMDDGLFLNSLLASSTFYNDTPFDSGSSSTDTGSSDFGGGGGDFGGGGSDSSW